MKNSYIVFLSIILSLSMPCMGQEAPKDKKSESPIKTEEKELISQNRQGVESFEGKDGKVDYASAKDWFEKAANQDYAYAQYNLGILYLYGLGVEKDVNKAKSLFEKAKDKCVFAKVEIDVINLKNEITKLDPEKDKAKIEIISLKALGLEGINRGEYKIALNAYTKLLSLLDKESPEYNATMKRKIKLEALMDDFKDTKYPNGKKVSVEIISPKLSTDNSELEKNK